MTGDYPKNMTEESQLLERRQKLLDQRGWLVIQGWDRYKSGDVLDVSFTIFRMI